MGEFDEYVPTIDAILAVSDLETVSVKKMRLALELLFTADFAKNKKLVNDLILSRYYKLVDDRARSEEPDVKQDTEGAKTKEKPSLKDIEAKDAQLAYQLQASLNGERLRSPMLPRSVKKLSKKEPKKRKPRDTPVMNALTKPMRLSPKLLLFFDRDEDATMLRSQITKELWLYIKLHDLQNPLDRREILCDEKMETVFGKKQTMFSITKVINKHVFNIEDVL